MKVKVKTLTQKEFELEVEADEKIVSIKEKIRDHEGFEVSSQRLIYAGKILIDSSKLSDHQVSDGDALVVMATKMVPKKETPQEAPATAAPTIPTPTAPNPAAAPAVADVSETLVKQLTDMGFPRAEAVVALRAAFMNPDRAVEYLMNGIPDNLRQAATAPAPAHQELASGPTSTPATNPPAENPLLFLLQQPQFLQMRALVQSNPQTLQPLLAELGHSNPDLLRLINENQEAFLDIINNTSTNTPSGPGAGAHTIQVTPAEKEAIDR
eukprot:Ihof_evm8s49 gene=Ihof_evmTU8s49